MNLYKITMSRRSKGFMVIAENESDASRLAEKQWEAWGYWSGAIVVNVELVAQEKQHTQDGICWLLIDEAHSDLV